MNKTQFLAGFTERKLKFPSTQRSPKGYWATAFWTKGRTCRWVINNVHHRVGDEPALVNDDVMLKRYVVGTAGTPFCLKMQVFDQGQGVIYSISTEDFYRHGRELAGRNVQFGCQVRYWDQERVNAEQPRLDMGTDAERVEH